MWPLGILFLFATAAPQHAQNFTQNAQQKPPAQLMQADSASADSKSNLCFTIRTYHFRHQDDQPPAPAGISTCTPANILQTRQVSRPPQVLFMPLAEKSSADSKK
jgi:hypothetical protein